MRVYVHIYPSVHPFHLSHLISCLLFNPIGEHGNSAQNPKFDFVTSKLTKRFPGNFPVSNPFLKPSTSSPSYSSATYILPLSLFFITRCFWVCNFPIRFAEKLSPSSNPRPFTQISISPSHPFCRLIVASLGCFQFPTYTLLTHCFAAISAHITTKLLLADGRTCARS